MGDAAAARRRGDAEHRRREPLLLAELPAAFGAVGDGVADDTAALQLAVFAAFNATVDVHIPGWHNEQVGPDVCLEAAEYLITDTLNFTHSFAKPSGCAPRCGRWAAPR